MRKFGILVIILLLLTSCQTNTENEMIDLGDVTPPWIQVESYEFETTVGNPINMETASAYDETDGPCEIRIIGTVNFNKVGEYYLKYVSKDLSGNIQEQPFTVIVNEVGNKASTPLPTEDDKEELGCKNKNAKDKYLSCNHMVSDVSEIEMIFQGNEGYTACMAYGDELEESKEIQSYKCVPLLRNDYNNWGYGIKTTR